MFGAEFIVRGAAQFGEPGVFMIFEETADKLIGNVRSLGFDLERLRKQKKEKREHRVRGGACVLTSPGRRPGRSPRSTIFGGCARLTALAVMK